MILQKDTVLNINVQQNEKIGQLIETDTGNPRDSANRRKDSLSLHNDSTLLNPRMKEFIKGLPDSLHKDSAQIKIPPNIIARMPAKTDKDTSVLEMAQKFRKPKSVDSLKPAEKALTDSLIQPKNIDTLLTKVPGDTSVRGIVKSPSTGKMQDSTLKNAKSKKDSSLKSDSSRYFLAFHNVRIFNDSLQSVCDSLFFSTEDSVFRLYKDPVIWNGQSQITGDTVYLFTKNKEPERLYVFENGMMINRTKEGFFNQIAGKTINAYFLNGHIDYARVRGQQSESIHYMQDEDSAYIGMNRATGDVIDFYFRKDELIKVLFINDIKGHMYPMNDVPDAERELRNFKWLDKRRPKNKFELYD